MFTLENKFIPSTHLEYDSMNNTKLRTFAKFSNYI